jgi:hypothetical protein
MHVRLAAAAGIGLALAVSLTGCGKNKTKNTADTSANAQASIAATIPPVTGGGSSDFCLKANADALAALHNKNYSNINATVTAWDAILADSPSAIHADVKVIDDFLHDVQSNNYAAIADASRAQDYAKAGTDIAAYAATNCKAK